jgi:hypothetical protein
MRDPVISYARETELKETCCQQSSEGYRRIESRVGHRHKRVCKQSRTTERPQVEPHWSVIAFEWINVVPHVGAMAQLGDPIRAKALLRSAARAFGPKEAVARVRCVVAEAEITLVSRDLGLAYDPPR